MFPFDRIDDVLGDTVERAVAAHHRRRLARHGHRPADAPAGGWADGGAFAPRGGNRVELLVDGAATFPRMVEDIGAAASHVHVAGWFFTPTFRMGDGGPTLRGLLAETAERCDVRVLAWAGAPLPLFRPDRAEVRHMRDELTTGTRIDMEVDARERPMHCHHEKLVVVDDRVAYVGGIDLTSFAGNRLDSSEHLSRVGLGWHDACLRIEGPCAADVAEHFRLRWSRPIERPRPHEAVGIDVQIVRTVPEHLYNGLREGEFTIFESYVRAIRSAQRFVYLESQFLWAPEIVQCLVDKLHEPPSDEFRIVVLVPARANNGQDDTRGQVGVLIDADREGGGDRFLACTLYQAGANPAPVYVHAKVGIVDDRWLTVGSANLNSHSFFNDTEVNAVVQDEAFVRDARLRLWSEHFERDASGDPAEWWDLPGQKVRKLDGVSRRSRALLGPLNGLIVDG